MTTPPWVRGRGLDRLLARETNVSDLLQWLSDLDPAPWASLVGFIPASVDREALKGNNNADLLLRGWHDEQAAIEVKVGHFLSERQREAYEKLPSNPQLYLAALTADSSRMAALENRWHFLGLTDIVRAWLNSADPTASMLAGAAVTVLDGWDARVSSVLAAPGSPEARPLSDLDQKFLGRVVSRRLAADLREQGLLASAGVTSGGGLPLLQAWTPIRDETEDRCFMAEVRWWATKPGGELRFGVDFEPRPGHKEDEEVRRAAFALAQSMDDVIGSVPLLAYLGERHPDLARFASRARDGRPSAKGDWERVIRHGFKGSPLPDGSSNNRRRTTPGFYGDGTLRFQAIVELDFTQATGPQLLDLISETLTYLRARQP